MANCLSRGSRGERERKRIRKGGGGGGGGGQIGKGRLAREDTSYNSERERGRLIGK